MRVFVLDKHKKPLMPCHPARARELLKKKRALVHRVHPFVIRLKDRNEGDTQPMRLKLDPGSKITGIAVVREKADGGIAVLNLFELVHCGRRISEALRARRAFRRRRRGANLRHRAPRFDNRTRPAGWLAPSLQHRVDTAMAWVKRIRRWAPLTGISTELVRFDTQAMQNQEISDVQYQQGTLAGYEIREYLLEKWGRKCAYCDATGVALQIEHLQPRARGGSDRASNLTLSCEACNLAKGARDIRELLAHDPKRLEGILTQAKRPLKDAAAVNSTRWALFNALKATGLPVESASGGRTKWNRVRLGVPKTHALDAACVGHLEAVTGWQRSTLTIKCTGRGSYQRTRLTKHGFPRGYLMREKRVRGFQTGDFVKADVPFGKKAGIHIGRVAVRRTGSFNIQTAQGVVQGVSHKHCRLIQRADGYGYSLQPASNEKGIA